MYLGVMTMNDKGRGNRTGQGKSSGRSANVTPVKRNGEGSRIVQGEPQTMMSDLNKPRPAQQGALEQS